LSSILSKEQKDQDEKETETETEKLEAGELHHFSEGRQMKALNLMLELCNTNNQQQQLTPTQTLL